MNISYTKKGDYLLPNLIGSIINSVGEVLSY